MRYNLLILLLSTFLLCFSTTSNAMMLHEFTKLEKDLQIYYLAGVLDAELVDASDGMERSNCVEKLDITGAYNYLVQWCNRDPENVNNVSLNVALLVRFYISEKCHTKTDSEANNK